MTTTITMQTRFAGWLRGLLIAAVALGGSVRAQEAEVDPPGRVARVAELSGQVWVYSPETGEWVAAARNQPLTSGDRLATESGARAELQIGSTSVRLDASTELAVVQLDDDKVALELQAGSAIARVRDLNGAGQLELATEEGRFVALQSGTFRVDRRDGRSDLTVYSGQARYEGPNSGIALNAGQRAEFWIDSGGVAQYSTMAPASDAFVAWSNDRDRRFVGSIAERYVSPEMTGAAELDAYGRWEQTPDYGSVWIPTSVAADWAPYSQGRWAYVRPWGWTWVDAAPWGFAPFHYGRWVYVRNNWCWTPGVRVSRPVYAPALVGWVGGGRGSLSVTVGGGPAVGWFPLAPREVYVPSYRVSQRYARNVNITHVTNVTVITNVFRNPQGPREFENRRHPRAITVVPSNVMAERRPIGPAAAQYRDSSWVRDIASDRGRAPTMLAPPVATPFPVSRNGDTRGGRPPPFARPDLRERSPAIGDRQAGFPPDRNEADRDRDRDRRMRDRERGFDRERGPDRGGFDAAERGPALATQPSPGATLPMQPTPGFARPTPGAAPTATIPPAVAPTPGSRSTFESRPGRLPPSRDGMSAPGIDARAPIAPVVPPVVQPAQPAPAAPSQERPTMRTFPMQRNDERREERREERRGDDRRLEERRPQRIELSQPVQPAPTQQPQLQQAPRTERSAMPMAPSRAVEMQRPQAPPAPAAVLPAAPPVQRAEPRPDQQRPQRPERPEQTRRGGGDTR